MDKIQKSEDEWKQELGKDAYEILRCGGTERAFTGELLENKETGNYICGACGNKLFSSDTKFDSGSGWPSFWNPLDDKNVELHEDNKFGIKRVEVTCARCGSHLGHVFDDAPQTPTGQRYCINSKSLKFNKK